MTEPQKDDNEKRGDELLKRMLKTPPKPHKDKADKKQDQKEDQGRRR
jgi:hypothetical protein